MSTQITPVIAGNWKLNPTRLSDALALASSVSDGTEGLKAEIILIPPTPFVSAVAGVVGMHVEIGGQNLHPEAQGAFTGEVSAAMWTEVGATVVLCGHSERRTLFGESDAFIAQKVQAAIAGGLKPILCVGESLQEREANQTEAIVLGQLDAALKGLSDADLAKVIIAYEPVWAIGTGKTASPEQAQAVHAQIRQWLKARNEAIAATLPLLYGGSVKASNAAELLSQPDINGALIGGASLKADEFIAIAEASQL